MNAKLYMPVSFIWSQVTPDPRAYKPSAPVLTPMNVTIVVNVPLDKEYIVNVERITIQQTTNQNQENPVLTPKGMFYCISELENAMTNRVSYNEFVPDDNEPDEWTK